MLAVIIRFFIGAGGGFSLITGVYDGTFEDIGDIEGSLA